MSTPTCSHVCSFEGCGKTFSRRDRLLIHLRTHTGERPYVCDCGKSYARSSHLTRHKETAHIAIVIQPLLCEVEGCNQTFTTKQSLNKHMKRRHEQKLYKCTFEGCNRSFHKHQHLTVHEYDHTKIKPFKCTHDKCEKSFLLPSKLKQHMKVHSGYPCDYDGCESKFDTWTSLRRHKYLQHPTVHTCTECSKSFTQKNALHEHLKSHSQERNVIACPKPNCGRTYLEQRNLMAHIRSYHDGHRFHCEFEGCDRSFTTKQKCQKHFLLHQMKGTVPKRKSRKGIKKKSCATKLTGIDSKVATCDSTEDIIRLSDLDNGMEEEDTSSSKDTCQLTENHLVQSLAESPGYILTPSLKDKALDIDETKENDNIPNEINGKSKLHVEINIDESVQDSSTTEQDLIMKMTSDQFHNKTSRNLGHESEEIKDVSSGKKIIELSDINSQFCLCDKATTNTDNTDYDMYHRGLDS